MTLLRVSRRLSAWLAYCWNPQSITHQKSDLLKDEPARVTARWIAKYEQERDEMARYSAPDVIRATGSPRKPLLKGSER